MTTANDDRARPSRGAQIARNIFSGLAWFFAAGVVLQVYFAGMGVLVDPSYFGWHTTFAHVIEFVLIVMLVVGTIGRVGWGTLGLNLLLFGLFTLQYVFMYGFSGPPRALHVVNALALFWFAVHLGKRSWYLARRRAIPGTPGEAADPGAPASPAGSARGGLSAGRLALGAGLIVVGALVLYGVIVDNESQPLRAASPTSQETSQEAPADAPPTTDGAAVFAENCAGCHGRDGQGGPGPALAGNDDLADTRFVVGRILNGSGPMPAWESRLTDEEVAAVASHIRQSWGNDFGPVAPDEVAARR